MSATVCRLLPFAVADGPHNMAADEALLESAAAAVASLRFYGWAEATVSLGYFQPQAVRFSDPLLAGLPWVRRPTGGGALVHHHEVTYALALPAGPPWQARGESWLCRMHRVVAEALASLGVAARGACADEKFGDVLCFQHHTPGDLLIGPAKVVGSAQRRQRGALLQHGSILLAASPFTPGLPGVAERSGRRLNAGGLAAAFRDCFARSAGWDLRPSDWTAGERHRIDALSAGQYASAAWNAKR
jgi:lipoate-protein ligase A